MNKLNSVSLLIFVSILFVGFFISFNPQRAVASSEVFLPLGQILGAWSSISIDSSNHNVYVFESNLKNDTFKRTAGTGNFLQQTQTVLSRNAVSIDPLNHNMYGIRTNGDIYLKAGGVGDFQPLGQTSRAWDGISVDSSNKNVYAVDYNGDIYKQTGGVGDFLPLNQILRAWISISVDSSNHNVYAAVSGGDIYEQTGGTGDFLRLPQTSKNWTSISVDSSNHNVYATESGGDIYKQTGGVGNFIPLNQTARSWSFIYVDSSNHNVYATVFGNGDIYEMTYGPDLTAGATTPTTAVVNVPQIFASTITNNGNISTGTNFPNFFQVATDPNDPNSITDLSNPAIYMPTLDAGGSDTANSPPYIFSSAGAYFVRACADKSDRNSLGSITESNEDNNCGDPWTPLIVNSAATAHIEANPTGPLAFPNTGSSIHWWSENADSCEVSHQGIIDWTGTSGTQASGQLSIPGRTYTSTCLPLGPNSSDSVGISVQAGLLDLCVIKSWLGTVILDPPGVPSIPTNCWGYNQDDSVTISTPAVSPGRKFTGWGGDCASFGKNSVCSLIMDSAKSIIANFVALPNFMQF
jgi:hypothetical protein